ncbi:hypothetical protein COT77_02320 [Candidatus Berkelbacteria bacterium CG10_big_fil_rev_8_21_14_0_10_41_12]|uniref:Rod shape-determining protein MreD n=1 Tax=Candidatus Berkelbacteria bacterium CG10_big_fil_rev_8_21_14_0_10_41_12 TaxID=1974513 RepID=A0A2M6WX22_9BACT|nr:MAG: hypothetical protein COT77_02320 [Candidatus Berkelbacteria bacterium CG10_big_fil_rev_8_21_14_0_10_41_12]
MKGLLYIIGGVIFACLQLAFVSLYLPNLAIPLLALACVVILIRKDWMSAAFFGLSSSLFIDAYNLQRIPIEVFFIILVIVVSELVKQRFIDFSNLLTLFLYLILICTLYSVYYFLIYFRGLNIQVTHSILLGFVISLILVFFVRIIFHENKKF